MFIFDSGPAPIRLRPRLINLQLTSGTIVNFAASSSSRNNIFKSTLNRVWEVSVSHLIMADAEEREKKVAAAKKRVRGLSLLHSKTVSGLSKNKANRSLT